MLNPDKCGAGAPFRECRNPHTAGCFPFDSLRRIQHAREYFNNCKSVVEKRCRRASWKGGHSRTASKTSSLSGFRVCLRTRYLAMRWNNWCPLPTAKRRKIAAHGVSRGKSGIPKSSSGRKISSPALSLAPAAVPILVRECAKKPHPKLRSKKPDTCPKQTQRRPKPTACPARFPQPSTARIAILVKNNPY
jgi:hypothetical protein